MKILLPISYLGSIEYFAFIIQNKETIIEKQEKFLKQTIRNRCKIYNSNGKIVSIPVNEFHVPGFYSFVWNPMSLSSGVYYIQLISDQIRISKKVVYLK